jgi:hypothetical protein
MSTRIGPASITVSLNIKQAMKDLESLEKKVKEVGAISVSETGRADTSFRKEEERREEEEKTSNFRLKQAIQQVRQFVSAGGGKIGSTGGKLAAATATITGVALLAESLLAATSAGIREAAKGAGPLTEMFLKFQADMQKYVSDQISELRTYLTTVFPTADQFKDITRARMLLGETPSVADSASLIDVLYRSNKAIAELERQKDKFFPESIGTIIGKHINGGMKK